MCLLVNHRINLLLKVEKLCPQFTTCMYMYIIMVRYVGSLVCGGVLSLSVILG